MTTQETHKHTRQPSHACTSALVAVVVVAVIICARLQDPLMSKTPLQNLSGLPVVGGVFLPWSPVEAVAKAAAEGAVRELAKPTLGPHDINVYK
jgi:hypothetical protein